jgi:hypothetical protein
MPARSAIAEVEDLVFRGTLPSDSEDRSFKLRDHFFRNVVAFWTAPSIDAQYFGLECIRALAHFGISDDLASLASTEHLEQSTLPFVLEHFDDSGGVRHALSAHKPSLYGCEMALAVLSEVHSGRAREGARLRRLNLMEFTSLVGSDRATKFVSYVLACELPSGGFCERAARAGGVITTDRGLRILSDLGVQPKYLAQHAEFLASCWIESLDGGHYSLCANKLGENEAWITPSRYCLGTVARYLGGSWRRVILDRVVERASAIESFIRDCGTQEGGFAYAPGDSASLAATWDVVRLGTALDRLAKEEVDYAQRLDGLRQACSIDDEDMLSFILSQKATTGTVGWAKGSQPNLYALASASRLASTITLEHLSAGGSDVIFSLAAEFAAQLTELFVTPTALFQGYPASA